LRIAGGYGTLLPGSSRIALTLPWLRLDPDLIVCVVVRVGLKVTDSRSVGGELVLKGFKNLETPLTAFGDECTATTVVCLRVDQNLARGSVYADAVLQGLDHLQTVE